MPPDQPTLDQQLTAAAQAEALLTPEYFARLVDRSRIEYDPEGKPSNLRDLARRWRRDHPWWLDSELAPVEAPMSRGPKPPAEFTAALERQQARTSSATERAAGAAQPVGAASPAEALNDAMRKLARGGDSFEGASRSFREHRRNTTVSAGRLAPRQKEDAP